MGLATSHPRIARLARQAIRRIGLEHQAIAPHDHALRHVSAVERLCDPENLARDADNRYLWRINRRRLEAEALSDFVHAAAGTLNLKLGGRPVVPVLADDEIWR